MNIRNISMKGLAAAVVLALSGTANAVINTGAGGTNGELFLTIWDPTAGNEASFVIGLNVNIDQFNATGSYTFNNLFSDPVFAATFDSANFTTQSAWRWNIVGASSLGDESRLLFTDTRSNVTLNNAATDNAAAQTVTFLEWQTPANCDSCGTTNVNALSYAGANWGSDFNGTAPASNAAAVGTSLNFYRAVDNIASSDYNNGGLDPATMTKFVYTWLLDATGTLTYNAAAAPVPLPAAVWLLASGLVGLVGVGRRKLAA
jgi:hypothetical protein